MSNSNNLSNNHISKRKASEYSTLLLEYNKIKEQNKKLNLENISFKENIKKLQKDLLRVRSHRNQVFKSLTYKKSQINNLKFNLENLSKKIVENANNYYTEVQDLRQRCDLLEKLAIRKKPPQIIDPQSSLVTNLIKDAINGKGPYIVQEILAPSDDEYDNESFNNQGNNNQDNNNNQNNNHEGEPWRVLYTNGYMIKNFERYGKVETKSIFAVERRDVQLRGRIDFKDYGRGIEFKISRYFRDIILKKIPTRTNTILNIFKNRIEFVNYDLNFEIEFVKRGINDEVFCIKKIL